MAATFDQIEAIYRGAHDQNPVISALFDIFDTGGYNELGDHIVEWVDQSHFQFRVLDGGYGKLADEANSTRTVVNSKMEFKDRHAKSMLKKAVDSNGNPAFVFEEAGTIKLNPNHSPEKVDDVKGMSSGSEGGSATDDE